MLQKSINLLPTDLLKKSYQQKKVEFLAIQTGYFILGSLLILTLFISLPTFILTKQVENIQEKVQQKQAIIENQKDWEKLIRTAEKQLGVLKELEKNTFLMNPRIEYLDSFLAPDIYLDNLHGDKEITSFSATTPSLFSFANLVTNLQKAKKIKGVELTASSLDKEKKQYSFSLNLIFEKENQ